MITRDKFLPTANYNKICLVLIILILFMYILENSNIVNIIGSFAFNYIIRPILWMGFLALVWRFPCIRAKGYLRLRKLLYFWAFNFAIIYIIISILAGLIDGLGKSPYDHSIMGIIRNIISIGPALVCREFIRSYLIKGFNKEERYWVFILIAIFMTFTGISFNNYTSLISLSQLVQFIGQYLAPDFTQNLFAGYLAYLGGPLTSITYMGVIEAFHWLSPVLPDIRWITMALIGILCPIFFMMSMQNIYYTASKQLRKKDLEESPLSWLITSIISILIVWFAVGVFPIYPSVIATGSMEPEIKPGDIILVERIVDIEGINKLKVGDIIQFQRDGILISHRIIDIKREEEKGISFITKGDNNSGQDPDPVKPENIRGQVIKTIPKLGWPTLLIKSKGNIPLDEIVF